MLWIPYLSDYLFWKFTYLLDNLVISIVYNNSNRPDSNYNTRLIEMSIVQNRAQAGAPALQKLRIMFQVHNSSIYIYTIHSLAWDQATVCLICNFLSISRAQVGVRALHLNMLSRYVIFFFKYKMVSLTIVFIGMVTQGGQDFTTLAVL